MTKKTLQGIAVGILLTTLLFAYQFYFTNAFIVVKEITIEPNEKEFDDQLKQHLETNKLVLIDKEEYDLFLQSKAKGNTEEKVEVAKPQPVVEKVVIKEVMIKIETGMSSSTIALLLEERGLIDSKEVFELYLKNRKLETKIQAGEYSLTSEMTIEEIVEKIT